MTIESWRDKVRNYHDDDDEVMLNVLRCHLTYSGQVVTNAEARFSNFLYVHGNQKAR